MHGRAAGLALALRRPADIACLALLATPGISTPSGRTQAQLLAAIVDALPLLFAGAAGPLPVSVIQGLFAALDPFLAERKFVRFAGLDPTGAAARGFVALEDWINDGVPLARNVALECARSWYRDNDPAAARGRSPASRSARKNSPGRHWSCCRAATASCRRAAAEPLAAAIPGAAVLRPPFGHIGMMASAGAPQRYGADSAGRANRRLAPLDRSCA